MTRTRSCRSAVAVSLATLGLAAVTDSCSPIMGESVEREAVRPLNLRATAIPSLKIAGYPTLTVSGRYPRVATGDGRLSLVNNALRGAVAAEETRFAGFLRSERQHIPAH